MNTPTNAEQPELRHLRLVIWDPLVRSVDQHPDGYTAQELGELTEQIARAILEDPYRG